LAIKKASRKVVANSEKNITNKEIDSVESILSVIGQKKRLEILRVLLDADAGSGVTSLAKELGVKAPTVEKHLNTLKKIGLVKKQITLDFTRERWVVRGKKRVSRLLLVVDSEIKALVEPGRLFEEVEKAVRRQQYFKEHESTIQEMEHLRKEGETLDLLLTKISKDYDLLLDDDEKKKVTYWITARNAGIL
jgi:DNA-binding MarR family transcriptional regulator